MLLAIANINIQLGSWQRFQPMLIRGSLLLYMLPASGAGTSLLHHSFTMTEYMLPTEKTYKRRVFPYGKGSCTESASNSESVYTQKWSTHGEGARILGDPTFNVQPWIRPPSLLDSKASSSFREKANLMMTVGRRGGTSRNWIDLAKSSCCHCP